MNDGASMTDGMSTKSLTRHPSWRYIVASLTALCCLQFAPAYAGNGAWTTGGPTSGYVSALIVDPGQAHILYAAATTSAGGGLYKSVDAGVTWGQPALTDQGIYSVAAGPSGVAYAGTIETSTGFGIVFKTTNGGSAWQRIVDQLTSQVGQLRIDLLNPKVVYRTDLFGVGPGPSGPAGALYRSTDAGSTWSVINCTCGADQPIGPLALDPQRSGVLFAAGMHAVGANSSFFRSMDFGSTWIVTSNLLSPEFVRALVVDPFSSGTIYAGTNGGAFRSTDGGATFLHIPAGAGLGSSVVTSLVADPVRPGRLFAGTMGGGVFVTLDSGTSWNPMNAGLSNLNVSALTIDTTGTFVHAGTYAGVFDFELGTSMTESLTGVVPVVISSPGANSAVFRTSIQLRHSQDPVEGQVAPPPVIGHIVFHPQATIGASSDSAFPFALSAGSVLAIPDVLAAVGQTGLGSLDVLVSTGTVPIAVTRVFNDGGPAGTFGFTEDLLKPADALNSGDRGILIAPPDTTQFRFNIGVRTLSAGATLNLTVRDSAGLLKRSVTRTFPATYMIQDTAANLLVDATTPQPLTLGPSDSITVQVVAGNAIVYGASADNKTNDPSFQVVKRLQ